MHCCALKLGRHKHNSGNGVRQYFARIIEVTASATTGAAVTASTAAAVALIVHGWLLRLRLVTILLRGKVVAASWMMLLLLISPLTCVSRHGSWYELLCRDAQVGSEMKLLENGQNL